jgi:hypothetical protein
MGIAFLGIGQCKSPVQWYVAEEESKDKRQKGEGCI